MPSETPPGFEPTAPPGFEPAKPAEPPSWLSRFTSGVSTTMREGREALEKSGRNTEGQALLNKVAPVMATPGGPLGRMATQGALSAYEGQDAAHTALSMLGAGSAEGGLALLGKAVGPIAGVARNLAEIRARVMRLPDGPVNVQLLDAVMGSIARAKNDVAREAALRSGMKVLDALGEKGIGAALKNFVVNVRAHIPGSPRIPLGASKAAAAVQDVAGSPWLRSVADAVVGTPRGGTAAALVGSTLAKPLGRHVPGVREVTEAAEEAAD